MNDRGGLVTASGAVDIPGRAAVNAQNEVRKRGERVPRGAVGVQQFGKAVVVSPDGIHRTVRCNPQVADHYETTVYLIPRRSIVLKDRTNLIQPLLDGTRDE